MLIFYICGYPRNQDGTIRKNGRRKILDIAHSVEEARDRVIVSKEKFLNRYDIRIYDGRWNEIK